VHTAAVTASRRRNGRQFLLRPLKAEIATMMTIRSVLREVQGAGQPLSATPSSNQYATCQISTHLKDTLSCWKKGTERTWRKLKGHLPSSLALLPDELPK
jgi:hypothetical protein